MSSTFATRLIGAEGRSLRLAVVVQGIPFVFQQGRTDLIDAAVALAGYGDGTEHTRFKGVGKVEQAGKEIDLVKRRMIGGQLDVELFDDSAGTLQALFAPRQRRVTRLVDNIADGAGDVTFFVNNAAAVDVGQVFYVGAETITNAVPDTGAAPDEIVCAAGRGAFGSERQAHFGGADAGAGIFLAPPVWFGRRVKLIGYFEDDDGTTTADLARVLDTFRLEAAPEYTGNGCWRLQCSHLSDEFASRKLGTGIRELEVLPEVVTLITGALRIKMDALAPLFLTQGSLPSFALIQSDGGKASVTVRAGAGRGGVVTDVRRSRAGAGIHRITDTNALYFEVNPRNLVVGGVVIHNPTTVKHIAILASGNPGVDLCIALTSRTGDGSNGTYDQLGGKVRVDFAFDGFRLGAGITAAEVDTAAFLEIGAAARPGLTFIIDEEVTLEEFLGDFCFATGSFWFVTSDGLLSVKRLGEERLTSAITIDDDVIIGEPKVTFEEANIWPRVKLLCNYDPVSAAFETTINIVDDELRGLFPNADETLDMESKAIVVDPVANGEGTLSRPRISFEGLRLDLRRIQRAGARGSVIVEMQCHLDVLTVNLGDVALLTVDVPDLEGSLISARTVRIIALTPDLDEGVVLMRAELLETLFVVAPACLIDSRAGATLTLQTTGPENSAGANPATMFQAGWSVLVYDVSTSTVEDFLVVSVSGTSLELSGAPTFAIEAGVDFVTVDAQSSITGETANANGYAPREFLYLQADNEIAGNPTTRWR